MRDGDGDGEELLQSSAEVSDPLSVDDNVFCECRAGFFFDARTYTCRAAGSGGARGGGAIVGRAPGARPLAISLLPYHTAR